jgi:hypothetical protein
VVRGEVTGRRVKGFDWSFALHYVCDISGVVGGDFLLGRHWATREADSLMEKACRMLFYVQSGVAC